MSTLLLVSCSVGVSLFFLLIIFVKDKLYLQYKNKELLFPTLMSVFFMGIGGLLYFFGIKYSSPSTAAILLLLQSLFAFIVFNIIGKEKYTFKQIIGAILIFIGGIIILLVL
ncbi:MAG: EamA family transporter [Candidatus Gracilibacteria bacterium]|nr:EamA family transporter [Candidatus Gracilibacteria bacterium]